MKRSIRWAWLVFLAAIMTTALPPAWSATLAAPPREKPPTVEPLPVTRAASAERTTRSAEKTATPASRISLDVQDADIKAVFRLLSEVGNVNIVSGDDVKGALSLHIKDVPWDQALDTILGIKGLSKIKKDDIVMVMTQENYQKLKKAEKEAAIKETQIDTEPLITRVVQVKYRMLTMVKTNKIDVKGDVLATSSRELVAGASGSKVDSAGTASVAGTTIQKVSMEGAGDFFALLQSLLSVDSEGKQRGWIGADADTNSVIITAVKSDLVRIMDMIAKIDIPTDQILIKANIVETTKNTARDLGIQWGGAYGRYVGNQSLYVTPGGTGGSTVPPGSALSGGYTPTSGMTGVGGQGYGVNFPATTISSTASASLGLLFGTIGGNILDVQLSALQKDGKMNILSSPSITTLDNQMAFTENGLIVPYATTETSGGTVTRSIKKEEATLRLEIVPHVIDGQKLKMKIVVKKNEVDFAAGHSVDGNPFIIKKQTETNLIVDDGETVVISGLTKQKTQDGNSGVPWFKDVPVLGWLFKSDVKSEEMEEVLIFITPNIVKSQIVSGILEGT